MCITAWIGLGLMSTLMPGWTFQLFPTQGSKIWLLFQSPCGQLENTKADPMRDVMCKEKRDRVSAVSLGHSSH